MSIPLLSVVTPAYNEAGNLAVFHDRLAAALAGVAEWEWIVVDDHSADDTFAVAKKLRQDDRRVRAVRLARNSGAHAAISCGLRLVRGKAAVILAADLQDPPELIPSLLVLWRKGAAVVWGARRRRPDRNPVGRTLSWLYTAVVRHIAGLKDLPPQGADCVLIGEAAISAARASREQRVPFFPLVASLGLSQDVLRYDKDSRMRGRSGWTLGRKIDLLTDSLTAFSDRPIRWAIVLALAIGVAGFLYALVVIANYAVGAPVEGWSSLMVALLVLNGLQLLVVGIVGAYVWRTLEEVRRRPQPEIEARADREEPP